MSSRHMRLFSWAALRSDNEQVYVDTLGRLKIKINFLFGGGGRGNIFLDLRLYRPPKFILRH
jgi:hypothetical protein